MAEKPTEAGMAAPFITQHPNIVCSSLKKHIQPAEIIAVYCQLN